MPRARPDTHGAPRPVHGVGRLPDAPLPVDVTDIPFILPNAPPDADTESGKVPERASYQQYTLRTLSGGRLNVRVMGDPKYGIPGGEYAFKTWISLFSLIDRHGFYDGRFEKPSVQMIADVIGAGKGGESWRSIQKALLCLRGVQVSAEAVERTRQLELAIVDRETVLPVHVLRERLKDPMLRPLEMDCSLDRKRVRPVDPDDPRWKSTEAGELYQEEFLVDRLWVHPLLVESAMEGWVAWIDTERFCALRSTIAMRLYLLFAGRAARARQPAESWVDSLGYLWAVCGLAEGNRPATVKKRIEAAGEMLVELGVLKSVSTRGGRGKYACEFVPGPELRLVSWLYGVRPTDMDDTRMLMVLLVKFGFSKEQARDVLETHGDHAHHILQYAVYLEQANPGFIKKTWSGWILNALEERRSYTSDRGFARWMKNGGRKEAQAEPAQQALPITTAGEGRCKIEPRDTEAADIWAALAAGVLDGLPTAARLHVEHLAPYAIEGDTLICCGTNSFSMEWVEKKYTAEIEDALARVAAGTPLRRFRVRPAARVAEG